MERSVLGSAVKTYGGKNRYSRSSSYSYRPSGLIGSNQNIFDDDDPITPFDRLLHEDKTKNTFVQATPLKSTYNGTINTIKTKKFQLHADSRSNALKSVQNVRIDSVSILKSSTVYKYVIRTRLFTLLIHFVTSILLLLGSTDRARATRIKRILSSAKISYFSVIPIPLGVMCLITARLLARKVMLDLFSKFMTHYVKSS